MTADVPGDRTDTTLHLSAHCCTVRSFVRHAHLFAVPPDPRGRTSRLLVAGCVTGRLGLLPMFPCALLLADAKDSKAPAGWRQR